AAPSPWLSRWLSDPEPRVRGRWRRPRELPVPAWTQPTDGRRAARGVQPTRAARRVPDSRAVGACRNRARPNRMAGDRGQAEDRGPHRNTWNRHETQQHVRIAFRLTNVRTFVDRAL